MNQQNTQPSQQERQINNNKIRKQCVLTGDHFKLIVYYDSNYKNLLFFHTASIDVDLDKREKNEKKNRFLKIVLIALVE